MSEYVRVIIGPTLDEMEGTPAPRRRLWGKASLRIVRQWLAPHVLCQHVYPRGCKLPRMLLAGSDLFRPFLNFRTADSDLVCHVEIMTASPS